MVVVVLELSAGAGVAVLSVGAGVVVVVLVLVLLVSAGAGGVIAGGAGAGTAVVVVDVVVSSFLPQAVREIASNDATRIVFFMGAAFLGELILRMLARLARGLILKAVGTYGAVL